MRVVALAHWNYLTWHLPATALCVLLLVVGLAAGRSLLRDDYGPAARALRWRLVGWSALGASLLWAVAWPYLRSAAIVRVHNDGSWSAHNYLGVPVAFVPAGELRTVRAVDLGGLGAGVGYLEVRRANGSTLRTVRLTRELLDETWKTLGYSSDLRHEELTDTVVPLHRYDAQGPVLERASSALHASR